MHIKGHHIDKRFISTTLAIYLFQGLNLLTPLLLLPILNLRLSSEDLGLYFYTQSIISVIVIIVEYGFLFSASRELVDMNKDQQSIIFREVGTAKIILSLISTILTYIFFLNLKKDGLDPHIIILLLIYAVSQGFSPSWYYQGIGRLHYSSIIEAICKALGVVIIVCFHRIDSVEKIFSVLLFASLLSNLILMCSLNINIIGSLKLTSAVKRIVSGWGGFFYKAFTSLYTVLNLFILGFLVDYKSIGYYGNAERILAAASALFWPLWRILSPKIVKLYKESPSAAFNLVVMTTILLCSAAIFINTLTWIFSDFINSYFFKNDLLSIKVLKILMLSLIPIAIGGTMSILGLMTIGKEKYINLTSILFGSFNVILLITLIPKYGVIALPWIILFVESCIAIVLIICFIRIYKERKL